MREREPVTKTIKSSEARQQWSELLNEVFRRQSRVIVEKSGIPVAAIVSAEDLERMERAEKEREERFKALDRFREAFKDIPDEQLEQEVGRAVRSARAKIRKERAAHLQA